MAASVRWSDGQLPQCSIVPSKRGFNFWPLPRLGILFVCLAKTQIRPGVSRRAHLAACEGVHARKCGTKQSLHGGSLCVGAQLNCLLDSRLNLLCGCFGCVPRRVSKTRRAVCPGAAEIRRSIMTNFEAVKEGRGPDQKKNPAQAGQVPGLAIVRTAWRIGGDRAVQLRLFVFGAGETHLNRPSK
jgi:hypothetical protein